MQEDKKIMARYFMGDTRLAGLERMMMDPSRTPPTRTDRHPEEETPEEAAPQPARQTAPP